MTLDEELEVEEKAIVAFTIEILHGSIEHRAWLQKAAKNFIDGLPVNHNNEYKS